MRFVLMLVVAFTSGAMATPAAAESAGNLLTSCEALMRGLRQSGENKVVLVKDGVPCWYYLAAFQDLSKLVDEQNSPLVLNVCAPEESRLTQFVRIFVAFANRHPEMLHQGAGSVVLLALREAFPCRR